MPSKQIEPSATHQVELAVRQLETLATLPSVARAFFTKITDASFSPLALAEIIESDPALMARILFLMYRQRINLAEEKLSFRQGLGKLSANAVRDAIFSVKVRPFSDFESDNAGNSIRKELIRHSLAVGCCAKEIAEALPARTDSQMAYAAGLLHDIGKLALEDAMPKSFLRITEEAKTKQTNCCEIEQNHLGIDHTILGKRLAQKWHFPKEIMLAVWLHHSDTAAISKSIPAAKFAQVVQLADVIARQCGIGLSGSYDSDNAAVQLAQSLAITGKELEQIRQSLKETVAQKSEVLGLDLPGAAYSCYDTIYNTAAKLIQKQTALSEENNKLRLISSYFDFVKDFLSNLGSMASAIEAAQDLAVRWQKFYQTGMVCIYLAPPADSQFIEVIIVENLAQTKTAYLRIPANESPIPKALQNDFDIINAYDHIGWLFERLDAGFNPYQTKALPLLSDGKTIGVIAFELRHPADTETFKEDFRTMASVIGTILNLAAGQCEQQGFAEQFAQLLSRDKAKGQRPAVASVNALAEMAAGAAHELNNPLSVISGRAQLLAEAEDDNEKKRMLKQVRENANNLAGIINDLMTFAKPTEPKPMRISIEQTLDEAAHLAAQKLKIEELDINTENINAEQTIFVDSAQIASAIANILCNCIESYPEMSGPIKVTAEENESGDFVKLQVIDSGCGMDSQTLHKAAQPFFSEKPAGRKRGMGLSHAERLIQVNKGSIYLTSQPGPELP